MASYHLEVGAAARAAEASRELGRGDGVAGRAQQRREQFRLAAGETYLGLAVPKPSARGI